MYFNIDEQQEKIFICIFVPYLKNKNLHYRQNNVLKINAYFNHLKNKIKVYI